MSRRVREAPLHAVPGERWERSGSAWLRIRIGPEEPNGAVAAQQAAVVLIIIIIIIIVIVIIVVVVVVVRLLLS